MASRKDQDAAAIAKALGHPLRIAIVREMRKGGSTSPNQVAMALGDTLGNVSYHFKVLRESGVVTLVDEQQRRGAMEHFYALKGPKAEKLLAVLDILS